MSQEGDGSNRGHARTKWDAIYRRLEAVQRTIEQGNTPEQERAILKARAEAMAHEPLPSPGDQPDLELVAFRLAHETYAFEARYIREIYPLKEFSPLPCTPDFVLGLVNVRGHLLSILDLKKFFGLSSKALDSHSQAIILHNETMEFAVLADTLLGMRHIARQSLQPSLPTLTGLRNDFLQGIAAEQMIVLDAAKLLSSREIIVYEEVEI